MHCALSALGAVHRVCLWHAPDRHRVEHDGLGVGRRLEGLRRAEAAEHRQEERAAAPRRHEEEVVAEAAERAHARGRPAGAAAALARGRAGGGRGGRRVVVVGADGAGAVVAAAVVAKHGELERAEGEQGALGVLLHEQRERDEREARREHVDPRHPVEEHVGVEDGDVHRALVLGEVGAPREQPRGVEEGEGEEDLHAEEHEEHEQHGAALEARRAPPRRAGSIAGSIPGGQRLHAVRVEVAQVLLARLGATRALGAKRRVQRARNGVARPVQHARRGGGGHDGVGAAPLTRGR